MDNAEQQHDQIRTEASAFAKAVREFLAAPKICRSAVRWRKSRNHSDYLISVLKVDHDLGQRYKSRVLLGSHIYFWPRKYTFALLLNNTRIYSLDVCQRRSHNNLFTGSVKCTHWSVYPCTVVVPDDREQIHVRWLDEFFSRCNIRHQGRYNAPIHDKEQLRLPL